jgi:hypothetical protein
MKNYRRFHKSNAILRDNQEQKENAPPDLLSTN